MTVRAAIYVRISDDPEGKREGVERQLSDCPKLAERRGWDVVETFEDNDISASTRSKKRRPEYQRMLKMIRSGQIDAVICYSSSRLTRKVRETLELIALHEEYGTRFAYVVSGEFDLSTADGRMQAIIGAAIDQAESEKISERVKRAVLDRAEKGEPHGTHRPFGITEDGLELVPEEADQIRQWYELILSGASMMSLSRLSGKHHSTVRTILTNTKYAGFRIVQGQRFPSPNAAVVPETTWMAVNAILKDGGRRKNRGEGRKWLGAGLYVCQICGTPVVSAYSPRSQRIYRCTRTDRGQTSCGRWWMAEPIDRYVEEVTAEWLRRHSPELSGPSERKSVNGLIGEAAGIRKRKEQLAAEFAIDDSQEAADYRRAQEALSQRLSDVEDKIASLGSVSAVAALKGSPEAFLALDDVTRKKAVVSAVMTVELEPSPKGKGRAGWFGAEISWNDESGEPQRAPHVTTAV